MRALRAEATHVLTSLSLITALEPFLNDTPVTIPVYTDCQGLINRLKTKYINKPSTVLDGHMDLVYQIRSLASSSNMQFQFIYTRAIKNDEAGTGSDPEKLVQLMHIQSYEYYTKPTRLLPRHFSDLFPASGITIMGNNKPIVSNISMTLQDMECRILRKDYFEQRMSVHPKLLEKIDTYTIGRVLTKTPKHHAMYSKIMHRQLNTMSVNAVWTDTDDTCPVCLCEREDWIHPLRCQSRDMIRIKERLISEMMESLHNYKTYPPLADFIIEYLRNLHFHRVPPPLDNVDPKYMVEFHLAYEEQNDIGWDMFLRGFVSRRWRHLQHCYLLQKKTKDVHAVDKFHFRESSSHLLATCCCLLLSNNLCLQCNYNYAWGKHFVSVFGNCFE